MPKNDTIFKRLEQATKQEKIDICAALKLDGDNYSNKTISEVYRSAGGHSFLNIFRDVDDLPYKQILVDVADKVKPGLGWTKFKLTDKYSEEYIEDKIIEYLKIQFEKEINSLSPEKRKAKEKELIEELKRKGYTQAQASLFAATIVSGSAGFGLASAVTLSIFYSGFFSSIFATVFGVNSALLAASGTGVGAIVALPLLVGTLGNPAYRKIIPTTIEFIKIRMRLDVEKTIK